MEIHKTEMTGFLGRESQRMRRIYRKPFNTAFYQTAIIIVAVKLCMSVKTDRTSASKFAYYFLLIFLHFGLSVLHM
jgi:hypothetical protein